MCLYGSSQEPRRAEADAHTQTVSSGSPAPGEGEEEVRGPGLHLAGDRGRNVEPARPSLPGPAVRGRVQGRALVSRARLSCFWVGLCFPFGRHCLCALCLAVVKELRTHPGSIHSLNPQLNGRRRTGWVGTLRGRRELVFVGGGPAGPGLSPLQLEGCYAPSPMRCRCQDTGES